MLLLSNLRMHAPVHPFHPEKSGGVRCFIALISGLSLLLGFSVLIGWYAHVPALIQLRPTLAPMQHNTALCFVMAGAALAFWTWRAELMLESILGSMVAAVGASPCASTSFIGIWASINCSSEVTSLWRLQTSGGCPPFPHSASLSQDLLCLASAFAGRRAGAPWP